MVRLKYLSIAAGCCLFLASCGEGGSETATQPAPAPVPTPAAVPSPAPANEVAIASGSQLALIPPTSPTVRLQEVKVGRSDPFASVALPPAPKPQAPAAQPANSGNGGSASSGKLPSLPGNAPPALPALPKPEQAQGVKVLGVAQIGGIAQAIVSAPEEKVSRTVAPGDRLSGGKVLVKAIDLNRAEPVIVLEQFGQIVEIPIGQPTAAKPPA